jgi:SsrA-binding protein
MGEKIIVENRRARFDYHILERFEAGVVLQGTEVKSLRDKGSMSLKDSYADIESGEALLLGAYIRPYDNGNIYNHDPERPRKLLMHKREIVKLGQRIAEKGFTLVPLRVYFKDGLVKAELGLCKGKQTEDKRATIKDRESKREMERAIKAHKGERHV